MRTLTINIPGDRGKLYEVIRYPAGEIQTRLTADGLNACSRKERYVIAANPIPDLIELAQLKDALDGFQHWHHRTLDLMYLPYARADRRFTVGDSFGLAVFADFINLLNFDVVYTFDVHSGVASGFVKNLINLDPVDCYNQLGDTIKDLGGEKGLCLIAPDKGAVNRYDLERYEIPVLTAEKTRDPKSGKLSGFQIDEVVKEYKKGLIVDDICDGGGTFIGLAEKIHLLNPKIELSLYISHGIFSQGLEKLMKQFGNRIYVSDFTYDFPGHALWKKL